jgi:hypothetical protein
MTAEALHPGFSEFDVLSTCALRIDGYAWAAAEGLDRQALMQPFWRADARADLLAREWDYQWAAWFMQQRTLRWSDVMPSGEVLALWRQLFLGLASKRPSPPFDRGLDSDGSFPRAWDARYVPHLPALLGVVRERLAAGTPIDEPLEFR